MRLAIYSIVQSLILSRIDYCNVAFAGLPQRNTIRPHAVINAAARLVLRVKKFNHISIEPCADVIVSAAVRWIILVGGGAPPVYKIGGGGVGGEVL